MIALAKEKYPEVDFQVMDAENISLDDEYDYIILSDVIGFFKDVEETFKGLKAINVKSPPE